MTYIALLRGINVGGKATISMAELKICFESVGVESVKTYINSGNVIFESSNTDLTAITTQLETAITKQFSHTVRVLIKTPTELKVIADKVPDAIKNDATNKCDVLFLWPDIDSPKSLEQLPLNDAVETVRYVPGAIIHQLLKVNATKSRLSRIVGTPLYQSITIRNINTVRKLIDLSADQ